MAKNTFGQRLNTLLAEHDKRQKDLAQFLGVSDNVISYYLSDQRSPTTDKLPKIADFFHTTIDYLLGRCPSESTNINIQAISNYTGLSDRAIQMLHELSQRSKGDAIKAEYQSMIAQYQSTINYHDAELTKLGFTNGCSDVFPDKIVKQLIKNENNREIFTQLGFADGYSYEFLDKIEKLLIESKKKSEMLLDFYLRKNKSEAIIELDTINELLSKNDIEKLIEYVYLYLHADIEVSDIEFLGLVEDNRLSDNAIDVAIPLDKSLFDASLLSVIRSIFEGWKDKTVSRIPKMTINRTEGDQNGKHHQTWQKRRPFFDSCHNGD